MTYTLDQLMAHQPSRWRSFTTDQEFLRCCGQDWGSFKKKRKPDEEAYPEWARHVADAIDVEYQRSDGALFDMVAPSARRGGSAMSDNSPLWCASDESHLAHSARNEFDGTNYCTGRPIHGPSEPENVR